MRSDVPPLQRLAGSDLRAECPEWTEDEETPRAVEQREAVLRQIILRDQQLLPDASMVSDWHRQMFEGAVPHPDYAGNFRDAELVPECLRGYDVTVGAYQGVSHAEVLEAVDSFIDDLRDAVEELDTNWSAVEPAQFTSLGIDLVVKLAAWAHGEWVRIHPFANGNGRTSRLWANYVFIRYGFGPVVDVRPRPGQTYVKAAARSMGGHHAAMEGVFWRLLGTSYSARN